VTQDVLTRFEALRRTEQRMAMATLVTATGSTSSMVGAKTFVGASGAIVGSVTIGGCIDSRAVEAADGVLASGEPSLLDIALADEEAWDLGLSCGGNVQLLVEPVVAADAHSVTEAYTVAGRAVAAGRHALVVRALTGSGFRLVLDSDGTRHGSLGDSTRDGRVAEIADARGAGAPCVVHDDVDGASYFIESFAPAPMAAIFGAGDVAAVLTRIVRELGMHVVIVDARARYATRVRFPDADEIRVGDPGAIAAELPATADTHVVILSHDYKFELPVLRHVLRAPVGYIGLMSSRKRGAALREFLAADGFTSDELARIRTPIGVHIGARTPAQVAVSIAAELVSVHTARSALGATVSGSPARA